MSRPSSAGAQQCTSGQGPGCHTGVVDAVTLDLARPVLRHSWPGLDLTPDEPIITVLSILHLAITHNTPPPTSHLHLAPTSCCVEVMRGGWLGSRWSGVSRHMV